MSGGGKRPLQPVPEAISNPAQTSRDRVAAYDEITRNVTLSKEFDAYKLKFNEKSQAHLQHEVDGVAYRLGIDEKHTEKEAFTKIESLMKESTKLASLPALQEASDILDLLITNLSAGLKPKSEIPTIVSQLVAGNGLLRNNAVSDTAKLAAREVEIQKLMKELQDVKVQREIAVSMAGRKDDIIRTLTTDLEELNKRLGPAASNTETVKRLDAEITAQRLNLERQQNESIALLARITSLDKELAHEKIQKDAFADQAVELTEQIETTNGEMTDTLALLAEQEKLVGDERKQTEKLTAYIMELGGMIAEVPDILSAGWLMKPLLEIAYMSKRPDLFNFDGLDADNLKLIQGHLQKFDMAMFD